jgi:phosphatidylglycerophosphate synthase
MPNYSKTAAHIVANTLPAYRVLRGWQTAERLRTDMQPTENRTWGFAGRVLLDALTDTVDGRLARYAGPTKIGGYLDQLADKAWFLQITKQLTENGEIPKACFTIPAIRDIGILAVRPVAHAFGLNPDAKHSGKNKMMVQVGAVLSACSPLAHEYPDFVTGLYGVATGASVTSGIDTLQSYAEEIGAANQNQPAAQLIVASVIELNRLSQVA